MKAKTKAILTAIAAFLGGILYRLGGIGKPFNTKVRDIGVPILSLGVLGLMGARASWYLWLLTFGTMFGAMTTYCKFGQEDVKWWNWLLTGMLYGLSALPITFALGHWGGFIARTIFLMGSVSGWSEAVSWDTLEEWGRGFLFVVSIPFLMIW